MKKLTNKILLVFIMAIAILAIPTKAETDYGCFGADSTCYLTTWKCVNGECWQDTFAIPGYKKFPLQ